MSFATVVVLAAGLLARCRAAAGAEFYLSPFGDDSSDGRSWRGAKRTVAAVVASVAAAGAAAPATVFVDQGQYLVNSVVLANNVTFSCATEKKRQAGVCLFKGSSSYGLQVQNANVRLEDVGVTGFTTAGITVSGNTVAGLSVRGGTFSGNNAHLRVGAELANIDVVGTTFKGGQAVFASSANRYNNVSFEGITVDGAMGAAFMFDFSTTASNYTVSGTIQNSAVVTGLLRSSSNNVFLGDGSNPLVIESLKTNGGNPLFSFNADNVHINSMSINGVDDSKASANSAHSIVSAVGKSTVRAYDVSMADTNSTAFAITGGSSLVMQGFKIVGARDTYSKDPASVFICDQSTLTLGLGAVGVASTTKPAAVCNQCAFTSVRVDWLNAEHTGCHV